MIKFRRFFNCIFNFICIMISSKKSFLLFYKNVIFNYIIVAILKIFQVFLTKHLNIYPFFLSNLFTPIPVGTKIHISIGNPLNIRWISILTAFHKDQYMQEFYNFYSLDFLNNLTKSVSFLLQSSCYNKNFFFRKSLLGFFSNSFIIFFVFSTK